VIDGSANNNDDLQTATTSYSTIDEEGGRFVEKTEPIKMAATRAFENAVLCLAQSIIHNSQECNNSS
jgi:hypothetical protein